MRIILIVFMMTLPFSSAIAQTAITGCKAADRACVLSLLEEKTAEIDQTSWRDQTYRELAKTLAFEQKYDDAIAMIDSIETPDTQAMTIRGIGMMVAETGASDEVAQSVFKKLRARAEDIAHPPSYAIALTYIAMSQAFAGDNDGAWKTAADMENDALRHKAYGETAEIQAEKGDFNAAMKSIEYIDSEAYRNKAYSITSKIFADAGLFDDSLQAAVKITNAYKQASAIQYMLDQQKPREQEREALK
jgi:predicted negative regulator of RcsB-dependent stress response